MYREVTSAITKNALIEKSGSFSISECIKLNMEDCLFNANCYFNAK